MIEREIKTISFGRAARDRLGMYLSADPEEALSLALREIYVNSLDALTETKAVNGKVAIVIDTKNRMIEVIDNGPGIPHKEREDGVASLVAAYTMPHTGSHFDERAVNSIGLNGIGASVVSHTASYLWVQSREKDKTSTAEFSGSSEGAILKHSTLQKENNRTTGVTTKYTPDEAVYGDAWLNRESLVNDLSEMMKFYPDVKVEIDFDGVKNSISYPKGLKFPNTVAYYESENLIISLNLDDSGVKPYGNRLFLPQGGAFFSHFRTQMTRIVNDLSGLKLTGAQVQAVFGGYVAIFVGNPLFSNQSKTAISNKEINPEITIAVRQELERFAKTPEWNKVIKDLETELKAEQAAQRARDKIKNAMNEIDKGSRKKVIAGDKLKDCINSGENAYLAICEGKSAKGSLLTGRDEKNVALYDIRGKFINCLKNSKDEFLTNEELIEVSQILGAGLFEKYNSSKLKYGKVLIAVDADEDGKNIADLLITFFYVCMPKFLQEGRLYWMKTPLYYKDGSYIFTEEEWNKVKNKSGYTRAKGLGEMSAKAVEESLFGAHKRWVQLQPANWKGFSKQINMLMGSEVEERRKFIFDNVDFERIKFL